MAAFSGASYVADAEPTTGSAEIMPEHAHAVMENGGPAPQHDAAGKKELSMPESKYIGMKVKTDYTINSSTMMMSAKSMFPAPNNKQPMELATDLTTLGLADYDDHPACSPVRIK